VKAVQELLPIPAGAVSLAADITVPESSPGVVLFAHGSGSSRLSPRNLAVAQQLQSAGLGTVLVDLLTEREAYRDAATAEFRFDISLLADRLTAITDWLVEHETTSGRGIGLFGASDVLHLVHQPTLLIVGERDPEVLDFNKLAMAKLGGPSRLEIVPRATHLFEEPGALEQVAKLATDWFAEHLKPLPRHEHDARQS
jgi:pimeloyl-ACP methyl ester carboxylesterase